MVDRELLGVCNPGRLSVFLDSTHENSSSLIRHAGWDAFLVIQTFHVILIHLFSVLKTNGINMRNAFSRITLALLEPNYKINPIFIIRRWKL